jgi:hypothetical protein
VEERKEPSWRETGSQWKKTGKEGTQREKDRKRQEISGRKTGIYWKKDREQIR